MTARIRDTDVPWYRQFWPWFIITLPACAVAASVATLVIAARGTDTLVVDDYNRIEETTARNHARDAAATALGLAADVRMDDATRRVTVHLTSAAEPGVVWQPARLRLLLRHPTRRSADQAIVLARLAGNRYEGPLEAVPADRRYVELLPDDDPNAQRPDWRLAAEWSPGREALVLSAAPPR